jgi:uncharacterized damage-inducible protein DinB
VSDKAGDIRQQLILRAGPGAAPESSLWLAALGDCRRRTLEAMAGIQRQELDWICPLSRNTIGTLLYHIAAIELDWVYCEILEQPFPDDCRSWFPHDARDAEGNLTRVTGQSARTYLARLEYVRASLIEALDDMPPAELKRIRQLEAYDVSTEWVVCHLLQHEAEHRGQIAVLRRRFRDTNGPLRD